ncbi:hypothetical protein JNX00_18810 [Hydrogenophaga sp. YM1]|uniref:hypothetical protein n=1 Tax=Hydrogenophaga sp. YM1 TaxID=2806262 RepID=UPI00195CE82F|nr:hypothetical protein [Hydrogenophaga sp. YM1]QRR33669.1 hypothetical protein JNX00_18810 [Hydrogenophaga sp. YM1]
MNQGNVRSIGDSTTAMNPSALALPPEVSIVVLCAEWCTQCRAFREVAADLPAEALHWVDIEDEGLDADELGITAFPSVAICRPAGVLRYLGPVRADREGFLAAVAQLHRLPPRAIPEPLRAVLPAAR